jgi:hypothetical protein
MDPRFENAAPVPSMTRPNAAVAPWPRSPRSLSAGRGAAWWSEGWRVFMAAPLVWIGMIVVAALIFIVLNFLPIIGQVAGMLIWPPLYGGLLLGCHALANGKPLTFAHLFAGFNEGRALPLILLGVLYGVASFVVFMIVMFIAIGSVGFAGVMALLGGDPTAMSQAVAAGVGAGTLVAMLVALVCGILLMMAWWFAPALVAINRADAVAAITAGFGAARQNFGAIAVALLLFFVFAIIASIPFGLGWLVLGPVAVGAFYASWREVFGE